MNSQRTSAHAPCDVGDPHRTHWSLVLAAGNAVSPEATQALSVLCQTYRYPVYGFIRRQGYEPDQAKDLTQEFFGRLVTNKILASANREQGRFRAFLCGCVRNFLRNEYQKAKALKRGGQFAMVSLDELQAEDRYRAELADPKMSPERAYDQAWALDLLRQAFECLKAEEKLRGKQPLFECLQAFLPGAAGPETSYGEIAARFQMSYESVRQAVYRLRSRFGEILWREIANTVANPAEVEDELKYLLSILGG